MTRPSAPVAAAARIAALAALATACSSAPPPVPESSTGEVSREGHTRQPVRATRVDVASLPTVSLETVTDAGGPVVRDRRLRSDASHSIVTLRTTFLPGAPKGLRRVEVVNEAPLGLLSIGMRSAWKGDARRQERPMTAFCGPEPTRPEPASWLTARPSPIDQGAALVRVGQGSFDGKRCELIALSGGTVSVQALEPSVPIYGFRVCRPPCRPQDGASLLMFLPTLTRMVVDADASTAVDQGAFTLLRLPLAPGSSSSIVARLGIDDAAAFRDALELPPPDEAHDLDVAIEVTQADNDDHATVGLFVAAGVAPLPDPPKE